MNFLSDPDHLRDFLEEKVAYFNVPDFIENDPVSIPHRYQKKQDIEIAGFWAAILAWGKRATIIKKCDELFGLMDNQPFDFVKNHQEHDRKGFLKFKHRTFNSTDTLYFLEFLQQFYRKHDSLEDAFAGGLSRTSENMERPLIEFHNLFFDLPFSPSRTKKHISSPARNSACKRLNMYLRWMVRKDDMGVDFGIWNEIKPNQLIAPCDVHVDRVARKFGLIQRKQTDWKTALELTRNLKVLDQTDPVKYDFALFGLGVEGEF